MARPKLNSATARPVPPQPTAEPESTPASSSLADIIGDSQARLAEAEPLKKSRGRPRKDGSPAQPRLASDYTPPPSSSSSRPGAPPPPPAEARASLAPFLAGGVKIPFTIAALKTGWQGWELGDDEATAVAEQLDQVLREYFPQLGEKGAALTVLAGSLLALGGSRFLQYQSWKAAQAEKPAPRETADQAHAGVAPQSSAPSAPAADKARSARPVLPIVPTGARIFDTALRNH